VRYVVEEPLNIRVEYHMVALAVEVQDSLDRLMAVAALDEPVGVLVELWLEYGR
jgi:hypothetical protein